MVFQSYLQKNNLTINKMRSLPAWSWNDYLRALCLAFATLTSMLAAAIVATAIHTYHIFVVQRAANNPWWLPLWPQHFDATGTKALIGVGSSIILLNIGSIVMGCLPKVRSLALL
jgi:hypothetical protein